MAKDRDNFTTDSELVRKFDLEIAPLESVPLPPTEQQPDKPSIETRLDRIEAILKANQLS